MRLTVGTIVSYHGMPPACNERFILNSELDDAAALSNVPVSIAVLTRLI